jgi:hypothetical protein
VVVDATVVSTVGMSSSWSLSSREVVHLQSSRAYMSVQNKGLQGSLGFPQSKSDKKIQAARSIRTKWKHVELVVATGQVCRVIEGRPINVPTLC